MSDFPNLSKPSHFLATFFGLGLLPLAPGTWGSLAALFLFYVLIFFQLSFSLYSLFLGLVIIMAIIVCYFASSELSEKDHQSIIIDEVAGAGVSFMFLPALGLYDFTSENWIENSYFAAALLLVLFRVFDILKPHPISYVDKRFKSGFGIVLDDLLAGVFAGLTLLGGNFFIDFF